MIRVVYARGFFKSASARILPLNVRVKLARLVALLRQNPFHSSLHTKQLGGPLAGLHSFRITRDWRVIFQFLDAETIQVIRCANRKDVYR